MTLLNIENEIFVLFFIFHKFSLKFNMNNIYFRIFKILIKIIPPFCMKLKNVIHFFRYSVSRQKLSLSKEYNKKITVSSKTQFLNNIEQIQTIQTLIRPKQTTIFAISQNTRIIPINYANESITKVITDHTRYKSRNCHDRFLIIDPT